MPSSGRLSELVFGAGGTSLRPLHQSFGGFDGTPVVLGKFMPMETVISVSPTARDVSHMAGRDERRIRVGFHLSVEIGDIHERLLIGRKGTSDTYPKFRGKVSRLRPSKAYRRSP